MPEVSTKPYLVRAIYEWCVDSGFRPFIAVIVDERTQVPREFVRNGEIVLNISGEATNRLQIGNELLEFEARFSGVARHVSIPIDNVRAIFAQENGHGMAFEVAASSAQGHDAPDAGRVGDDAGETEGSAGEGAGEGARRRPAARAQRQDRGASAQRATEDTASGHGNEAADRDEAPRAAGKRAASKRARKTVLREVGASESREDKAQDDADRARAQPPAGKRPRRPAIAAVPRSGDAERGRDQASTERPRGPDDGPGPGTTPGKPRLTRVK